MKTAEDESARESAQNIGEPVGRIIPGAIFEERLVEFIPNPDERKDDNNGEGELLPSWFFFLLRKRAAESSPLPPKKYPKWTILSKCGISKMKVPGG